MSKVWFITGAGSGIGAGIARAALKAGDRVVATARNLDKLRNALRDVAGDNVAFVWNFWWMRQALSTGACCASYRSAADVHGRLNAASPSASSAPR